MIHSTIALYPDYSKIGIQHIGPEAFLTTYIHHHDEGNRGSSLRPTILICPGGGYNHLSLREGEPIALKMISLGYNACVLSYSLTPNRYPCQLLEAACAMALIRENAALWHTDPDKIIIAGFSAGAHVAGSLGTMWKDPVLTEVFDGNTAAYKPTAMLLSYPVITAGPYAHRGSFTCLVDDNEALYDTISLEKRVNEDTVPAFIWHTFADQTVPVENSFLMASALRKYQIPCELHIFQNGKHGLALATEETNTSDGTTIQPECSCWPTLFDTWCQNL